MMIQTRRRRLSTLYFVAAAAASSLGLTSAFTAPVVIATRRMGVAATVTTTIATTPGSLARVRLQVSQQDQELETKPTLSKDVETSHEEEHVEIETFDPLHLSEDFGEPIMSIENELEHESDEKSIWVARAILLLVAAIWGTNFASVKYLENLCFHPPCHHFPSEFAFARFGVAAAVSVPLLFKQRWDVIQAGLICGMFISLGYATQAMALSSISSGKCAFICSLTVVFVPLASALIYGKPIKPTNLVAAAVALSGVGVLEGLIDVNDLLGIKPAVADTGTVATAAAAASSSIEMAAAGPLGSLAKTLGVGKGDILALGQPIGFGSSFMAIEHYQEKYKDVPNRVLTIAAAQCVAVGLLSLLWVLYDYHGSLPDFHFMEEPHRLAAIAWTGIVTTVVAIFLEGIALQTASATDAAITFSSEPVWASIFGFLLLHENLSTKSYVGGSIIMAACLLGSLSDLLGGEGEDENAGEKV